MDIFEAARTNQISELELMLKASNPNMVDSRGSTPLIIAGYYNNKEATAVLLSAKADPDLQDQMGNTALMGACFKGFNEIAELLLNGGATVDKQNSNEATALIFAATFGRVEIIKMLLARGANPLIQDRFGRNAVDHAKVQENVGGYELLATAANIRLQELNSKTAIL